VDYLLQRVAKLMGDEGDVDANNCDGKKLCVDGDHGKMRDGDGEAEGNSKELICKGDMNGNVESDDDLFEVCVCVCPCY